MKRVKEQIIAALSKAGFQAQAGLPWKMGSPLEQKKICVSIRRAETKQRTVSGYLGTDSQDREQFAAELETEFSLWLLSSREKGGSGCEEFGETVFTRLLEGIDGFPMEHLEMGQCGYDSLRDCFSVEIRAVSTVTAYVTVTDEGAVIEKFVIRGSVKGT